MYVHIDTDAANVEERGRASELLRLIADMLDERPELLQQGVADIPSAVTINLPPKKPLKAVDSTAKSGILGVSKE